jgi:hypothetical protein
MPMDQTDAIDLATVSRDDHASWQDIRTLPFRRAVSPDPEDEDCLVVSACPHASYC